MREHILKTFITYLLVHMHQKKKIALEIGLKASAFLLLMDVNKQLSDECSEYVYPHLNIHNSSTRSHPSEEENRTRNHGKNCKCKQDLTYQ